MFAAQRAAGATRTVTVMEVERLELQLEQLQRKQETDRQCLRETEKALSETKATLELTKKNFEVAERTVKDLTFRIVDTKAQVREEIDRNTVLERRVNELLHNRDALAERDAAIRTLREELSNRNTVLAHARMSLREEKEKSKVMSEELAASESLEEEAMIARGEAHTLKRLLVAKDALLIQKGQELATLKAELRQLHREGHVPEEQPDNIPATFPCGAHFVDPEKESLTENERLSMMSTAQARIKHKQVRKKKASVEVSRVPFKMADGSKRKGQREDRLLKPGPKSTGSSGRTSSVRHLSPRSSISSQNSVAKRAWGASTSPNSSIDQSAEHSQRAQPGDQNDEESHEPKTLDSVSPNPLTTAENSANHDCKQSTGESESELKLDLAGIDDPVRRSESPAKSSKTPTPSSKRSGRRGLYRPRTAASHRNNDATDKRTPSTKKIKTWKPLSATPRAASTPSLLETILDTDEKEATECKSEQTGDNSSSVDSRARESLPAQKMVRAGRPQLTSRRPRTAIVYPQRKFSAPIIRRPSSATPAPPTRRPTPSATVTYDNTNNNNKETMKSRNQKLALSSDSNHDDCVEIFQKVLSGCLQDTSSIYSKLISIGDRVVVDLAKKSAVRRQFEGGLVKYVGRVEKSWEDYRIHVGLELDNPVGACDGTYMGKRYFTAPEKHGKMTKIYKIRYVLDPEAGEDNAYVSIRDKIEEWAQKCSSATTFN